MLPISIPLKSVWPHEDLGFFLRALESLCSLEDLRFFLPALESLCSLEDLGFFLLALKSVCWLTDSGLFLLALKLVCSLEGLGSFLLALKSVCSLEGLGFFLPEELGSSPSPTKSPSLRFSPEARSPRSLASSLAIKLDNWTQYLQILLFYVNLEYDARQKNVC